VEHAEPTTGPISPELVLVDPDLGAAARAALPDHPWPAPVRVEPAPKRGRARRLPVRPFVGPALFAVALVILGLMALRTSDRPTFAAEVEPVPASPAPPATTPAPQPVAPLRTQAQRTTGKKSVPPQHGPRSRRKPAPPAKTKTKTRATGTRRSPPAKRREAPRFKPARTFSWPRQTAAAFYQVTFLRNGKLFYRTRIGPPRLELPPRIRFTPGRYHWIVRPVISGALADPIVDSTFEVARD
jgi:hypothetical protein